MKTQIKMILVGATLSLAACSGSGFVPASQAPRVYTAAHDTVEGDCHAVNIRYITGDHSQVVRCVSDMGGVSVK